MWNFLSWRRKYIRCWAFFVREQMFSSHFRSLEMTVPRKRKESTVATVEPARMMEDRGHGFFNNQFH